MASEATSFMTAVFACDLRKLKGNPHLVETPFGKAEALAVGNMLERLHDVESENAVLQEIRAAAEAACTAHYSYSGKAPRQPFERLHAALAKATTQPTTST